MLYCWTSLGFPLAKLHWSVRGRGVFYSVCIWDVWLFLAALHRRNPFNPIHIWNLMFTSWVIVGKEDPIQTRLDPEPTLARRPACQLLFLQISSAPGTSAGIRPIETSSRALKPSSSGMIYTPIFTNPVHHWKYSLYVRRRVLSGSLQLVQAFFHLPIAHSFLPSCCSSGNPSHLHLGARSS